jgi:hypothetical protein
VLAIGQLFVRRRDDMNIRAFLSVLPIVMVAPFMTGCLCSGPIVRKMDVRYVDRFSPSAVYRKGCTNDFALEGTRYDNQTNYHAFLIIPEQILQGAHLQTNEDLSLGDIHKMYDQFDYYEQETVRIVPRHYVKVADLPNNDIRIGVEEHYPNAGWVVLMPVTIVVDVVTFPFQVIYVLYTGEYGT